MGEKSKGKCFAYGLLQSTEASVAELKSTCSPVIGIPRHAVYVFVTPEEVGTELLGLRIPSPLAKV